MHDMEELREMLCDELEKITKAGKITSGSLDLVDKLTHSIKSIDTIMAMEESGYSNNYSRSYAVDRYDGRMKDSYDDYSRDGYSNRIRKDGRRDQRYNYSRGSYEDGYSRDLKRDLEDIMHGTQNEEEKRMIKKWIKQLDD